MLVAGKLRLICLLAGLLTIGEVGLQAVAGEAAPETKESAYTEDMREDSMEGLMRETYEHLTLEEESLKEQLAKKEAVLDPDDEKGLKETEELKEHIRTVQLQKMVLQARLEELFPAEEQ